MALTPINPVGQYTNGCVIAYENLLTETSTNDDEALTPNTFERAREVTGAVTMKFNAPASQAMNFIGIAAHNLSGETVTVAYATTTGGGTTTITTLNPTTNDPILIVFDEISLQEVVITYTGSKDTEVGYVSAGQYLKMPYPIYGGHTPINLSPETEYQNNMSESGQFLGRNIVRQGVSTSYSFRYLDPDFIRGDFETFTVSARTKPFFMQWRPDLYPDEVAFGYTTNDISVSNSGGGIRLMNASFTMRGHRDI